MSINFEIMGILSLWSVTDAWHCVEQLYTLIYAHLNGTYQGWGVIATMNGIVYQPPWTFRPSFYPRRLPSDTCLVSKKFYTSSLTNYDFGVAMGGLLLKLQNFKKVKLIFGHPVYEIWGNFGKNLYFVNNCLIKVRI